MAFLDKIEELDKNGLLQDRADTIIAKWMFPLHSLNLKVKRVKKSELQKEIDTYWPYDLS